MQNAVATRTPAHMWIVGVLALLWNGFGAVDYTMTRTRNADWIASMMPGTNPETLFQWIDAFPVWASFGWGLGVWGGLFGALLLLMRNRWAVPVLALSLLGAVLGLGYQIFLAPPPPPPMDSGAMAAMPWVIIGIAAVLYYYAHRQKQAGVLK